MSNEWVKVQQRKLDDKINAEYFKATSPEPENDEWIYALDQAAWRAWVRESWLPVNAQGLQKEPVGKARQEVQASQEDWKESTLHVGKAWI